MLKTNNVIAIIDSGIGGISILKKLLLKFNGGNYIYYADNLFMPYGNKTKQELEQRLLEIINLLKEQYGATLIIVACNTASSVIKNLNLKDVVVMRFDRNKTYLTTHLTKKLLNYNNIIEDKTLAQDIENNILNIEMLNKIVKQHINKFKLSTYKEIVLGCTHYELVSNIFKKYCPKTKFIANSDYIIDKIEVDCKDKNIVFLQSKQDIKQLNAMMYLLDN